MRNFQGPNQGFYSHEDLEQIKHVLIYDVKSIIKEDLLQLNYKVENYLYGFFSEKFNDTAQPTIELLIDKINSTLNDFTYIALLTIEEKINNFQFDKR
jgi:hypothetical protein